MEIEMTDKLRHLLTLVAGLAALLLVSWLIWAVAIRPGQKADEATAAKADTKIATGKVKAATDAVQVIERHFNSVKEIDRVTVQGNTAIMAAPGASEQIPADVARAARAALCLQDIYHSDPACQFVPDIDPAHDAGADTGSAAAAG